MLAAACSSADTDDESTTDRSTTSTTESAESDDQDDAPGDDGASGDDGTGDGDDAEATPPGGSLVEGSELAERFAELEGQLAIGNGTAVAVARPDGQALQVLGSDNAVAAQPTWSHEGTALAWSSSSTQRQGVLIQDFDDEGRPDGDPQVSVAEGFPIFYLQWSEDDQGLVFLRGAAEIGQVEFGFLAPGEAAVTAGQDTPFFVAWSPGSDQVLAHVGQRTVELHDPDAPDADPVEVLAQGDDYSAPAWIDDERVLVIADDNLSVLTIEDGSVSPLEPAAGPIRFVLSPDRRRVAYRLLNTQNQGPLTASFGTTPAAGSLDQDGLVVLDLETGERAVLADDSVAAWEWSPDGSRLAWLSLPSGGPLIGTWNFWSVDGSELASEVTPAFGLTRKYAEVYLPFFAQYTHSVTGWSPDSSAFAFAGNVAGERGVWIQLLDDPADAQLVSSGDFVTWGPGPAPNPSGGASAA
ncbi:MAG: hypothetical protein AAFO29_20475 [Actinomycetota bacterium]